MRLATYPLSGLFLDIWFLSESISEIIMSISQTIFNLRYIYHAMLKLRAFLLQKGFSCYSGVMVAHSSGSERSVVQVPVVAVWFVCFTLSSMGKKTTVVFDPLLPEFIPFALMTTEVQRLAEKPLL